MSWIQSHLQTPGDISRVVIAITFEAFCSLDSAECNISHQELVYESCSSAFILLVRNRDRQDLRNDVAFLNEHRPSVSWRPYNQKSDFRFIMFLMVLKLEMLAHSELGTLFGELILMKCPLCIGHSELSNLRQERSGAGDCAPTRIIVKWNRINDPKCTPPARIKHPSSWLPGSNGHRNHLSIHSYIFRILEEI